MSDIAVTVEQITDIVPHPQADRLEIAKILGTQTLVPKGEFQKGERVVFFPPDICLPPDMSRLLGVQQYLRSAVYENKSQPCRVAATRLRGTPSYGFIIKAPDILDNHALGSDVSCMWAAWKYEPPLKISMGGDGHPEPHNFPRYTDIQNYYRYSCAFEYGKMVRVTEKTHGTNCRVGCINFDGCPKLLCGSHKSVWKEFNVNGKRSLYWEPLQDVNMQTAVEDLSKRYKENDVYADVIVYCEIFGPRIQDLDYGIPTGHIGFRVFDIRVNGRFLNWGELHTTCTAYGLQLVPLIYIGPFGAECVQDWTNGPTLITDPENIHAKFKGREGCVITPLEEEYSDVIGGRLILKSVSADYLARKGAQDNA
jgi:RNA ligase (TIGR02306 family)